MVPNCVDLAELFIQETTPVIGEVGNGGDLNLVIFREDCSTGGGQVYDIGAVGLPVEFSVGDSHAECFGVVVAAFAGACFFLDGMGVEGDHVQGKDSVGSLKALYSRDFEDMVEEECFAGVVNDGYGGLAPCG